MPILSCYSRRGRAVCRRPVGVFRARSAWPSSIWTKPADCAVNPVSIRELELAEFTATSPKIVAVIGGGPAGLEQPALPTCVATR